MIIKVTSNDLKLGIVGSAMGCALGRAFNRDLVGSAMVLVERDQIHVFRGSSKGWANYPLSEKLIEYNRSFDLGDPLKPYDFQFDPETGIFSDVVPPPVQTETQKRRDPFYDPTPTGQGL